jgi:hypothetical protein
MLAMTISYKKLTTTNFFVMKRLLVIWLLYSTSLLGVGQAGLFKLTYQSYPATADFKKAIFEEFGSNYKIVDFNDLKEYFARNNSMTIDDWYNNLSPKHWNCCFYWVEYNGRRDVNYYIYKKKPGEEGWQNIYGVIEDLILIEWKPTWGNRDMPILCKQIIENPIITIEVHDVKGLPDPMATVSFCNKDECQTSNTDSKGLAYFSAYDLPTFITAFDRWGRFGLGAQVIDQSRDRYIIQLPPTPLNNYQAGDQINDFLDVASNAYGYLRAGLFISSALESIEKGVTGVALPSLGVPGMFSINPIPVIGADGKLGVKISGKLFDEILRLWKLTNPMYKDRVYYEYLPSY